jgi:eukaryotic-like serine/threonine-protein kinase
VSVSKESDSSKGPIASPSVPVDRASPDTEALAAQMSALLADLVRTPDGDTSILGSTLHAGDRLGRLTLVRPIGRGGFGVVWEAEDPALGRVVAVKAVKPGARMAARGEAWLKREAEAVARLNHPCIVTLYDFGTAPTGPYLVFELLRGRPLDLRLEDGPLPFDSTLTIAIEVGRALVHAHRAGVVHRDLKPGNVFLCDDGAVKVLDFGLAHLLGRGGAGEGGTPAFMAPEQWRGEPGDERTDLFAFGALLHAAASGHVPYPTESGSEKRAVLQPGPTPQLAAGVGTARFRKLVRRCLERDPAARPATAAEVVAELKAIQHGLESRWRRRALGALAAVAIIASAGAGWQWWTREPPPGERLTVVLADVENLSGSPKLDALGSLLSAALEPSRRLKLVTRPRLLAMAREARLGDLPRVDEKSARALARVASADVLLLTTARREGAGYAVQVRGLEPENDRALFSVGDSAEVKDLPALVDRLAEAIRRKLRERREDLKTERVTVAQALTPSVEAAARYFEGVDCVMRPGAFGYTHPTDCRGRFEAALALDPAFALAHYRLGLLEALEGDDGRGEHRHLAAALRGVDRLTPHDSLLVRALQARVAGHPEEASRLYDQALAEAPDDLDVLCEAAAQNLYRSEFAAAVPYLERVLTLDPGADYVLPDMVRCLGSLGRWEALRALVERIRALPSSPARIEAVTFGLVWLGEPQAAVVAARRAVADGVGAAAQSAVAWSLMSTGEFEEFETMLRARIAAVPGRAPSYWALATSLAGQGRFDEALATLDRGAARGESVDPGDTHLVRSAIEGGRGDPVLLWREAVRSHAIDPSNDQLNALLLALEGDLPHAAELAGAIRSGTPADEQYRALLAWRAGDAPRALALLDATERHEPWPSSALYPSYLVAEVAASLRDHRAVLSAAERFHRLWPRGYWCGWASTRVLFLTAEAHAALGERQEARADLDRLLARLRRADPGLPLLRQARALAARL